MVGHSGSGKIDTVALTIPFYDVQAGAVTIDGQNILDVTQQSLRQTIGIVPQDTSFCLTIRLRITSPMASRGERRRVIAAAKAAYIRDFVASLPDGYQSMVGERGLKLSGGEKQRVAIARTLLKTVFDDLR